MLAIEDKRGDLRCTVRSEDDAWELLARIEGGEFGDRPVEIKFIGWPKLQMKFWVGNSKRVLTAPMMEGLLTFQSSLHRAFLLVEEGSTNLRSLSEEDRKREEIRFRVNSGSTEVDSDLVDVAKEFVKSVAAHMTGQEVTIVLLVAVLLWASTSAFRSWLDYRAKLAQDDTNSQTVKEIIAAGRVASAADVEKMALMTKAIESAMGSRALIETGDEGKEGLLRAASKVDDALIAGVSVPPETARRIVRNSRKEPSREQLTSTFRVVRTDPEFSEGFRVKIRDEATGEEFFAGLRDAIVNETERSIIMKAEWEHATFEASVAVLRHRGEITSAEIIKVIQASATDDPDGPA